MDRRFLAVVLVVGLLVLMGESAIAIIVAVGAAIVIISRKLDAIDGDYPDPKFGLPWRKGKYIVIKSSERETKPPNGY